MIIVYQSAQVGSFVLNMRDEDDDWLSFGARFGLTTIARLAEVEFELTSNEDFANLHFAIARIKHVDTIPEVAKGQFEKL